MRVTAYDVMDLVHVTIHAWESPSDRGEAPPQVLQIATDVAGVGESEIEEWAKEALIAAVEAL